MIDNFPAVYSIGLEWDELALVSYNPLWPLIYKAEADRLKGVLAPWLLKIEHVGSTSIPYWGGKPIIDIIGVVSSLDIFYEKYEQFCAIGYHSLGECGRPGRFFLTYNRGRTTLFHLHIVEENSIYWRDLIEFRNLLRSNKKLSFNYHCFKHDLLDKYQRDRTAYRLNKSLWFDNIKSGDYLDIRGE